MNRLGLLLLAFMGTACVAPQAQAEDKRLQKSADLAPDSSSGQSFTAAGYEFRISTQDNSCYLHYVGPTRGSLALLTQPPCAVERDVHHEPRVVKHRGTAVLMISSVQKRAGSPDECDGQAQAVLVSATEVKASRAVNRSSGCTIILDDDVFRYFADAES